MVLAPGLTCGASGAIVWTQKRLTQMWVNKPGSQGIQQGSSRLRGSIPCIVAAKLRHGLLLKFTL